MYRENRIPATILAVDDPQPNPEVRARMLSRQSYIVRSASSGDLALQMARAIMPDLILLDIDMPRMNGYEVCKELKADECLKDVPVIFISALSNLEDKITGFRVGGVDYITKPFHVEEVLARVRTHLDIQCLREK